MRKALDLVTWICPEKILIKTQEQGIVALCTFKNLISQTFGKSFVS